ncbi:ABC transporter ATP-binding protein [Vreelandella hamiltonii]|uniref:ABC transporter domain-containing protein n=1 Tax=Halomonas johnsoniae TaxID=502832 RepID=A0ABQ2WGD2_9GAMM|nr:ABC transporter ATP-binding protein [Halomonas johnsoniae]GGW50379.1 hypothetical protein GCM10007158_09150 [Halomonas johnsoniae]
MIEIKNLYKRYHNHHGSDWVLKDINLTIPTGVSVGLIGRNGAGKSTLLRLIAGMDTPERGEVIRHSRVSWPVGLAGGMQNNMTGRQNAKFVARAQGCNPAEVKRVLDFVQDFAEIGEAFDEPVRTYSSGMRSRLSFGLSLSFDFDVYISDEATAVGDRAFKAKAQALFKEKVGKASLIMVSHGEGILRDLCQVGIYIKDGQAHWYDDINDAILAYHNDVDNLNGTETSDGDREKSLVASSKEQYEKALKRFNVAEKQARGVGRQLSHARKSDWPKSEVVVLEELYSEAQLKLKKMTRLLNATDLGARRNLKNKLVACQGSVKVTKTLYDRAEKEGWDEDKKRALEKALKNAQHQQAEVEAQLEKLDGLD